MYKKIKKISKYKMHSSRSHDLTKLVEVLPFSVDLSVCLRGSIRSPWCCCYCLAEFRQNRVVNPIIELFGCVTKLVPFGIQNETDGIRIKICCTQMSNMVMKLRSIIIVRFIQLHLFSRVFFFFKYNDCQFVG